MGNYSSSSYTPFGSASGALPGVVATVNAASTTPSDSLPGTTAPAYNPTVAVSQPPSSSTQDAYGPRKQDFKGLPTGILPTSPPLTPWQSTKAVIKGLISPLTDPFDSPTKFCIAVGMFAAHAALIAATGGAAAPVLLAVGAITAVYQGGKGVYELNKADTPEERKKALTGVGAGIANIALLGFGSKPALKEGHEGGIKLSDGIDPDKSSSFQATVETVKRIPDSVNQSMTHLRDGGQVRINVSEFKKRQIKEAHEGWANIRNTVKDTHEKSDGKWHLTAWSLVTQGFRSLSLASMFNLGG